MKGVRTVPRRHAESGQHGTDDHGRGRQGGYRKATEGLRVGGVLKITVRCRIDAWRAVCDGRCEPAVGELRVPEKLKIGIWTLKPEIDLIGIWLARLRRKMNDNDSELDRGNVFHGLGSQVVTQTTLARPISISDSSSV